MPDDTTTVLIVALVFLMIAVMWLELRYMRKKSKARRLKAAKKPDELQDEAHNALLTTRAIVATVQERNGIQSEEVASLLREAQMAYDRRNYRVAVDLTSKAKDRLMSLKAEQGTKSEVAKLETLASSAPAEEPTTKEVLQKDYPPNLIQSRFAISMAESSIEDGRSAGRDVSQAQTLLATAQARFDGKDYAGALSGARLAQRSALGQAVEVSPPAPPPSGPVPAPAATPATKPGPVAAALGSVCPSCGAPMKPDDAFCRKCGTRVVLTNCPSCGASLLADDVFCRKCGARIQR